MIKTIFFYIALFLLISCGSNKHREALNSNFLDLSGKTGIDLDATFTNFPTPTKLEVLILDSLQLKLLPKSIIRFKNLKHISLAFNANLDLQQAFENIKELPIEFINLQKNQLTKLPENIKKLQSLTDINLSYNNLKDENTYLFLSKLPHLNEVWLAHNYLQEVPTNIGYLTQISRLYLGHNQLEKLPEEMSKMQQLKVLHLEHNHFKKFPELFLKTPALLLVHLNNNAISKIPKSFEGKKISIKGLILDNNPIPEHEIAWAKKEFNSFFLLSFQQKK